MYDNILSKCSSWKKGNPMQIDIEYECDRRRIRLAIVDVSWFLFFPIKTFEDLFYFYQTLTRLYLNWQLYTKSHYVSIFV